MRSETFTPGQKVGREEIAAHIRSEIVHGNLHFGAKISENLYAREFGVSRTPVREAILSLSSLGLLKIKPQSGTYVTTFSETSLRHLFEVRKLLEAGGVQMASTTKRLTLVDELERLFENMELGKDTDATLATFHDADTLFHEALVAAAGNPQLIKMYQPISACAQAARSRLEKTSFVADTAQRHHFAIVDAIRHGDMDRFDLVLSEHLTWVLGMLMMVDELFERPSPDGLIAT